MLEKLFYSVIIDENGEKAVRFENYVYEDEEIDEEYEDGLRYVCVPVNAVIFDGGEKFPCIKSLSYTNKVYSRYLDIEDNLYSDFLISKTDIDKNAIGDLEHNRTHRSIYRNPITEEIAVGKYFWDVSIDSSELLARAKDLETEADDEDYRE